MLKRTKYFTVGNIWYLLLLVNICLPPAEAQPPGEYSVKAAFVYNFLKYVDWPASAGCSQTHRFKLGILGMNHFEDAFDKFRGKPIGNCFLEIFEISGTQPLDQFHAVFICKSEATELKSILTRLTNLPVLTIGDSAGFMQAGVMINLIQREDKLGFEINMNAARAATLTISSQLLKLASDIQE
jgi:hypothetical protein